MTPKRNHRALWKNVRIASDPRLLSQLEYLQTASALALGCRPPSISQLVRRAVGMLVDHYADNLREPRPEAVTAEREAMETYSRIVDAEKVRSHGGPLSPWQEALRMPLGLEISAAPRGAPTKEME
jgi:hypothetical protein